MATLQGKAVKNTYRQVLQIGANNVGVSGTLQPVQDGAGVNTALSLSTLAATVNGDLTITGDLIITGGGIQIKDLIDDTVAALIQNGTGITWTYNDGAATLTGNFTGTTSVVPEGSNLYYTQGRFDSAFAAKSTTNLAEGTNLYFTTARGNANFATNLAASDTDDLAEGSTNLYFTNARARLALSITAGTGIAYNNTTGVFNLAAIPNASLTNSSITINGQAVSLGGSVTLTTTNIAEGTNLYWTEARGNSNFTTNLAASTTTNLAEGTNLYYTQARFDTAFSNKSTTNLAEGTNLYYTQARFNSALAAKTTTDLAEGTNLYYTDARARLALSSSATGLSYANNSGVFSLTAGYAIPTTVKLGQYDIAYNRSIVSAAVTGTSTKTLSLTQQDANVITATWTDQGITTINGTANQIAATTVGNTTTIGFTNDVTMPNNLVVSGNLTINGTATYVNTESISSKDPLFEVANTNNTTDAVDIGYYGRYYDAVQERVEFTGLFRDASDAGKFKIFSGLVDEPTNVVNTTGTGYTVATLVANVDGNLNGTANAANILSTARTISATGDATWSVSFDGSANATAALTLANTGVTATTYGTSTAVPTIAVDSKGRITSASNTNITFPVTTVNGFAGTVVLTTSDVAEGTNQYFTTARAQASITGGASSVVTANLTASRALVSDGSGKIAASATTTTTEVGYLAGVTSAIQTQLNSKLNLTGGTLTGPLIGTTGSFSSSGGSDTFTIGHTSGSGIALNITKSGNGEGLYINKASGSGNAATIVGNLGGTTASFSSNVVIGSGASSNSLNIYGTSGVGLEIFETSTATNKRLILTQTSTSVNYNATFGSSGNQHVFQVGGTTELTIDATNSTFANAIIGTSATFSSSVTASSLNLANTDGYLGTINSTGANGGYFEWRTSGTTIADIGTAQQIFGTGGNGTFGINARGARDLVFGTNNTERMRITSAANVGIGTSNPNNTLDVRNGGIMQIRMGTDGGTRPYWQIGRDNVTSGDFIIADQVSERMRITSGGSLLAGPANFSASVGQQVVTINNTRNSGSLDYALVTVLGSNNNNTSNYHLIAVTGSADKFYLYGNGTYTTVSDRRLKKNISKVNDTYLDKVLKLNIVNYHWNEQTESDALEFGMIAQEVEEIIPSIVHEGREHEDGQVYKGIQSSVLPYILIKAMQEQQAQIEELKALIAAK
jgi:hypothetical protein